MQKFKIPNYQNGHAYLTSHRICYVAAEEPRKYSVSVELKDVDRVEYQAGFLKSSPKITIYPKPQKHGLGQPHGTNAGPFSTQVSGTSPAQPSSAALQVSRGASPAPKPVNATWICPICSFSNPVPSNFDPATATASTPLPPCLACGIKPQLTTILKAAIAAATNRAPSDATERDRLQTNATESSTALPDSDTSETSLACPRCTFNNHPSLLECEICGASLVSLAPRDRKITSGERSESPAPPLAQSSISNTEINECIKLSFRGGGEKIFHERLKGALIQRKWLLQNAPPIPQPSQSPGHGPSTSPVPRGSGQSTPRPSAVGIAGLEQRGLETRKNNELVIGNAFEDLEALMASAKEVVALAETLASESGLATNGDSAEAKAVLSESAAALGMVTTKDMLGSGAENLYLSELSRNLAEYLTDDRKGILRKEGGIMSLIDLWAVFNRSRNGVELVSPSDFQKAAQLWEKLKLPVRLRRFKSGLLVVQPYDLSDEKTIQQLEAWMEELRQQPPSEPVPWDWRVYGRGVTAQEAAQHFGWSVGVAAEELEMAEDRGVLCREEGIEGVRFWKNHFDDDFSDDRIGQAVSLLTL
ncbi:Vacuolar protein sorting protein (Vps36) [Rasamsonia emersonii CBS 393.64]|uniref:Vacuolar protein-sorting-associated protein 36 n=1 Tax=Rasamsonia emersonii (strain ATCC 16479 / CBS 393.64 / IMI 116815) TaxID=1408163 RepID=A0A0F4YV30_RASE3|nr:Vacuolar protein sorting protein (Vps36) [Rasamsonia emersonii CBS 393.64]KKA22099.1 Vacuolar protein sorting protein (Vps36) [Rasamsonia emersonii CBS 393.64]